MELTGSCRKFSVNTAKLDPVPEIYAEREAVKAITLPQNVVN